MKASMFQHNGGLVVHIKDGKYVSPKKNVNFKKISLLTASAEDRCFQRLAKKAEKKTKM